MEDLKEFELQTSKQLDDTKPTRGLTVQTVIDDCQNCLWFQFATNLYLDSLILITVKKFLYVLPLRPHESFHFDSKFFNDSNRLELGETKGDLLFHYFSVYDTN